MFPSVILSLSFSCDYTYDELTDGLSTCSGSVNDILDELNREEEMRDSRDLDNLDLDDLTIPDVIKLPNNNNNSSCNNNKNLGNNNNNNVNKGYAISDENNSKSSIISNVKVVLLISLQNKFTFSSPLPLINTFRCVGSAT